MGNLELIKNIALMLGVVDFLVYVSYIWGRYGIQRSISISVYDLPVNHQYIFRMFIWILSLAIILTGIGWGSPLFLISGSLLSLVGIFCHVKTKWKFHIHMVGAIGGILACFAGVMVMNNVLGVTIGGLIILETLLTYIFGNKKHMIWNVEVICFANLMGALLLMNNNYVLW
jgi:hypothetical protein